MFLNDIINLYICEILKHTKFIGQTRSNVISELG